MIPVRRATRVIPVPQGDQGDPGPQGDRVIRSQGDQGDPGASGVPCTVVDNGNGTFTMSCPDGSSVSWSGAGPIDSCTTDDYSDVYPLGILSPGDEPLGPISGVKCAGDTDEFEVTVESAGGTLCFPR